MFESLNVMFLISELESIRSHDTMERVVNQKYLRIVSFKTKERQRLEYKNEARKGPGVPLTPLPPSEIRKM